jgi:hypothetical protein
MHVNTLCVKFSVIFKPIKLQDAENLRKLFDVSGDKFPCLLKQQYCVVCTILLFQKYSTDIKSDCDELSFPFHLFQNIIFKTTFYDCRE